MKKKIVVLILTLICILGLTGCGGKDNQEFPTQNVSEPEAYFERQNLVLIILEEGSGSIRHEITDVRRRWDENGASLG